MKIDPTLKPLYFTLILGLVVGLAGILFVFFLACNVEAKVPCKTLACGIDAGKSFLPADSFKGMKMRYHFQKMHKTWGPWCWKYQPNDYVGCLSRIWFESRGDPFSRTKDTMELEAGLTSVSWDTAKMIEEELGKSGDPCADPEFSIFASAWRKAHDREMKFTDTKPNGEPRFWASFLPDLWESNRIEAEYFLSVSGSVNSQKIRKLLRVSEKEVGTLSSNHPWWNFISWLRKQSGAKLAKLTAPLKVFPWRFGFRIGRSSFNGWKKRAEFFPPIDGKPNYCWGSEMFLYPDPMPEPKLLLGKKKDWRKTCIHYSKKKARAKHWNPPAKAHGPEWETWVDEMQALDLLPTDEEYATLEHAMSQAGCGFQILVSEEAWSVAQAKHMKKVKKNGH